MKHEFHMVLNSKIKDEIEDLSIHLNKSISSTVVFIIKAITPFLEKYHFESPENKEDGKYRLIDADEDLYIYLDENDYRMIKHIYSHMYIYSMAIIIRKMITIFLDGIKKQGFENFIGMMNRLALKFRKKFAGLGCWEKRERRKTAQMRHESTIQLYKITFSSDFSIKKFELIN
jgi:hypothetical protein